MVGAEISQQKILSNTKGIKPFNSFSRNNTEKIAIGK